MEWPLTFRLLTRTSTFIGRECDPPSAEYADAWKNLCEKQAEFESRGYTARIVEPGDGDDWSSGLFPCAKKRGVIWFGEGKTEIHSMELGRSEIIVNGDTAHLPIGAGIILALYLNLDSVALVACEVIAVGETELALRFLAENPAEFGALMHSRASQSTKSDRMAFSDMDDYRRVGEQVRKAVTLSGGGTRPSTSGS